MSDRLRACGRRTTHGFWALLLARCGEDERRET